MHMLYIVSEVLHADDPATPKELARFRNKKKAELFAKAAPESTTTDHYRNGEWVRSTSILRAKAVNNG